MKIYLLCEFKRCEVRNWTKSLLDKTVPGHFRFGRKILDIFVVTRWIAKRTARRFGIKISIRRRLHVPGRTDLGAKFVVINASEGRGGVGAGDGGVGAGDGGERGIIRSGRAGTRRGGVRAGEDIRGNAIGRKSFGI